MNGRVEQFLNELEDFAPGLSNGDCGRDLRNMDGKTLGELLTEQPDAVLAAALGSTRFRNEIVEELLFIRHRTRLMGVLRASGADLHTAENLLQDLCANVLQGRLDNFDADREFGRYLRTMVRNLHRSSLRRRQPIFTEDMGECIDPDTVDQDVAFREMLNRFEEAIQSMPPLEQSVMRVTGCRRHLIQILDPELPPSSRGRPRRNDLHTPDIAEPSDLT